MSKAKVDGLSPAVHTAIGGVAGIVEVCIMQPTVAIKNALQEGRPLPANPAAYYRGLLVNGGSVAPITAVQFGVHRILENVLRAANNGRLDKDLQIIAAGAAGSSSSLMGCPAELIMIQQQKSGRGLIQEASQYVSRFGARHLYRGLMTTATRDGIYTASYLGISPALQAYLDESPSFQNLPPTARFLAAAIATGSLAAVVTQPVDTIKTRMQAFPDIERMPEYTSIRSTAKLLVQANGALSLWTGLLPRLVRLSGAAVILQVVRNQMIALLEGENEGK